MYSVVGIKIPLVMPVSYIGVPVQIWDTLLPTQPVNMCGKQWKLVQYLGLHLHGRSGGAPGSWFQCGPAPAVAPV